MGVAAGTLAPSQVEVFLVQADLPLSKKTST
jgi:hypothetical protein